MKQSILALGLSLTSMLAHSEPEGHWQFELLHSLGWEARNPQAGLVRVGANTFWGTAHGGENGDGSVFKYSPSRGVQVMHHFEGSDGRIPDASLLLVGDMLYGTTQLGGQDNWGGTIFRISTSGVFTSMGSFVDTTGREPKAQLVQGTDGNFYGTTSFDAADSNGSVFRMDAATGAIEVVHSFHWLRGGGSEGRFSEAPLVRHPNGYFYGTTLAGGLFDQGALFRVGADGSFALLHSFLGGNDPLGCKPQAGLTLDLEGNMVGVTSFCGKFGAGTLFKMSPKGAVTLLHSLSPRSHGTRPLAELVRYKDGRFYGTTYEGALGCGSVFSKGATPRSTFTLIHRFPADGSNGCGPIGALAAGGDGALYGTTSYGGQFNEGTIYRIRYVTAP